MSWEDILAAAAVDPAAGTRAAVAAAAATGTDAAVGVADAAVVAARVPAVMLDNRGTGLFCPEECGAGKGFLLGISALEAGAGSA